MNGIKQAVIVVLLILAIIRTAKGRVPLRGTFPAETERELKVSTDSDLLRFLKGM